MVGNLNNLTGNRTVLKDYEVPELVRQIGVESGRSLFVLAEKAGLGTNVPYNWSKGTASPRLPQFLWFLDAAGYRLVLEKKEDKG